MISIWKILANSRLIQMQRARRQRQSLTRNIQIVMVWIIALAQPLVVLYAFFRQRERATYLHEFLLGQNDTNHLSIRSESDGNTPIATKTLPLSASTKKTPGTTCSCKNSRSCFAKKKLI